MTEPRNYPDIMMKGVLAANGYRPPIRLTDEQRAAMREVYARRGREKAAASAESARYYSLTARGRLAAEKTDEMMRAQLDGECPTCHGRGCGDCLNEDSGDDR